MLCSQDFGCDHQSIIVVSHFVVDHLTLSCGPPGMGSPCYGLEMLCMSPNYKTEFLPQLQNLENQDTMIIRTLLVPQVPLYRSVKKPSVIIDITRIRENMHYAIVRLCTHARHCKMIFTSLIFSHTAYSCLRANTVNKYLCLHLPVKANRLLINSTTNAIKYTHALVVYYYFHERFIDFLTYTYS